MDPKTSTNSVLIFIFGFVLGVGLSSFVSVFPLTSLFIILIGIAILVAEKIWSNEISKEVLFLSLLLLSVGLGTLRYAIKDFHEKVLPASTGVVISQPEQRENTTRFVLLPDNGEKVLVNTDLYSPVQYGDRVTTLGKLQEPGIIEGEDGGKPFNYAQYLAKDNIYYTLSFTKVEIQSGGHGNPIKQTLFNLKKGFVEKIKEILSEPYASLLAGLIVSGREAMPKDILEDFRRAGLIHIVVLSGYNITIIAEFMRRLFQNLFLATRIQSASQLSAIASIVAILMFVVMTGAEATVVRASIMVLVVIVAKMFGRSYSASRALLVAGFLMLIENPKILVFDPSFQLSFLATLALIYIVPIFNKYLSFITDKWGLKTIVITTMATQIMVLPFLVYSTGDVSLVSIFSNILVLMVIPIVMFVGFVSTIISYINATLALPLAYLTYLLLAWILFVSNLFGNLSLASIAVPPISVWLVVFIYLIIFIFVWRWRNSLPHSAN